MFGAICGDILGSAYEFEAKRYNNIGKIVLCRPEDRFTDNTILTLAVADWLLYDWDDNAAEDNLKDFLAAKFLYYARGLYGTYHAGYDFIFKQWLAKYDLLGEHEPYNSFSNISAVRVTPIAWLFNDLDLVRRYARLQAEVTHNHPESVKGAEAVAAAVFLARSGRSKKQLRSYIIREFGYPLDKSVAEIRKSYKFEEACPASVQQALAAFLDSNDYESAIRLSISFGGDSDTIACIAGGIAEAFYGSVPEILAAHCRNLLTDQGRMLIDEFTEHIQRK